VHSSIRTARLVAGVLLVPSLVAAVPLSYSTHTPPGGHGELDTPAVWVAPDPTQSLLFVTDKTWNHIEIHDPIQNTYLGRLGITGSNPGQLDRPNAVAVGYGIPTTSGPRDILFVVERDNHRVSLYLLPYGFYVGEIGSADLVQPMGIALYRDQGQPQIWITDIGPKPQRVVVFDVIPAPSGLAGSLRRTFDVPSKAVLESIVVDPVTQRALVCDEDAADVMVYDLLGTLLDRFGVGHFTADTEGLTIFETGNGNGYVIVTDQKAEPVVEWEVFDRHNYGYKGHFSGETVATDGITLVQQPLPGFPHGAFFAAHADSTVHAYSWADIATATGLCPEAPCVAVDAADRGRMDATVRLSSFPAPFRGSGTIRFHSEVPARVDIAIFDLHGARVAELANRLWPPGVHDLVWDGRGRDGRRLPAGVYFVRARTGATPLSHKVMLLH
jgi:3-phytase